MGEIVATGSQKLLADDKQVTLTTINNIFPFTQVAREIGLAEGWSPVQIKALDSDMLAAIRNGSLQTRSSLTGLPNGDLADIVLHLVHSDDVNNWLKGKGLDYRWSAPTAQPPDPERRLARLRTLGGTSTYSRGKWSIKGIAELVKIEKAECRSRCDEKTIRADLKNASQSERDAKTAGFSAGLGQR